jgi:hypothetical protein
MKTCEHCLKKRRNAMFKKGVKGLGKFCSICRKTKRSEYCAANRDKIRGYNRKYAAKDPEKYASYFKRWCIENFGSTAAYYKDYYERKRENVLEAGRRYRERNREAYNAKSRERKRLAREAARQNVLLGERCDTELQAGQLVGSVANGDCAHSQWARESQAC